METYRQPFRGTYAITQRFGETVTDPKGHSGIDYDCPENTEILASAAGIVRFAGWDTTGYGNCVIIQHTKDRSTLYAHLSKIRIRLLQEVDQGQLIGLSGWSGNVVPAGPAGRHLHFEARTVWSQYRTAFDPMLLPLMSMADPVDQKPEKPKVRPAGVYKIACQYAFVRTWGGLIRDRTLSRGTKVYIFDDVQYHSSGLPYHYIGADLAIAEYVIDGTLILEEA